MPLFKPPAAGTISGDGVYTHRCHYASQIFYLNDDGSITCAICDEVLTTVQWHAVKVH